jgi:hypothetical protein
MASWIVFTARDSARGASVVRERPPCRLQRSAPVRLLPDRRASSDAPGRAVRAFEIVKPLLPCLKVVDLIEDVCTLQSRRDASRYDCSKVPEHTSG